MSRSEISDARRQVCESGWLAATPPDFQAAIVERCIWQRIDAQVTLTHGGDTEGGMFGIISGAVSIFATTGPSDLPIAHVARAPFWFGELPAINGQGRVASAVTRTTCDIALLPQKALEAVMATNPAWWRLLGLQSMDMVRLVMQIGADLLIADTERRCAAVLLRVAGCRTNGDVRCDAGVGQDELAAMGNMSRQTTGKILRALEAEGVVELGYRTIAVINPAKLRNIVDI